MYKNRLFYIIFLINLFMSCANMYQENDTVFDSSKYKESNKISDLLKETTLQDPYLSHRLFYSADGHGFFDTFTVLMETIILFPFVDIPVYIYDICGDNKITFYPSYYFCLFNGLIGIFILYIYDIPLHDIPVLFSKPFVGIYHKIFGYKKEDFSQKIQEYKQKLIETNKSLEEIIIKEKNEKDITKRIELLKKKRELYLQKAYFENKIEKLKKKQQGEENK